MGGHPVALLLQAVWTAAWLARGRLTDSLWFLPWWGRPAHTGVPDFLLSSGVR